MILKPELCTPIKTVHIKCLYSHKYHSYKIFFKSYIE
jgi:hypothetical protein